MKINSQFFVGFFFGLLFTPLGFLVLYLFFYFRHEFLKKVQSSLSITDFWQEIFLGGSHKMFFVSIALSFAAIPFFHFIRKGQNQRANGVLFFLILGAIGTLFLF